VSAASAARPGVDLIEIKRLERALERHPRLAQRLFTAGELGYARDRARPARHLAARFAAKEAAVKALGGGLPISAVEVVGGHGPGPALRLHGPAERRARSLGLRLAVSLSHSREIAAAVVVATSGGRAPRG
jgi:holo-[acyl-carrier protein] synthase